MKAADRNQGSLVAAVARTVALHGHDAAVRCAGRTLSYHQLWEQAGSLAIALQHRGIGRGSLVGVWGSRDVDLLTAILGILRAGGAYVPLEPSHPAARIASVVQTAQLSLVVSPEVAAEQARAALPVPVLGVADSFKFPAGEGFRAPQLDGSDLAYVIFTSGSTGRPRGVVIEQGGVLALLRTMALEPGLRSGEVMMGLTTPAFDLSVPDLFLPLVTGATLVLATETQAHDPQLIAALLAESKADLLQATPATWRMLCDSGWQGSLSLRAVCGGEALDASLARRLASRVGSLHNFYGPTEASVWAVAGPVELGVTDPVPMGRPLPGTSCYICDDAGELVVDGEPGELCLAGDGVARGYLGEPEQTAARFLDCPFADAAGTRMYRTGDIVRRDGDGQLIFLGRADHQVKLRGFRVELGDVEAALRSHPTVGQVIVNVVDNPAGAPRDPRLVGYVVPASGPPEGLPVAEVLATAAKSLPPYMVPHSIIAMAELPLTPNRKVDRAALPIPSRAMPNVAAVAARSPLEELVLEIWAGVLEQPQLGVEDDVFAAGATSLEATRVAARVGRSLGVSVPVAMVFEHTTVALLSEAVLDIELADAEAAWPEVPA